MGVRLEYDSDVRIKAVFGIIPLKLYPGKEKGIRLADFRIDRFRKLMEKKSEDETEKSKKTAKKEKSAEDGGEAEKSGLLSDIRRIVSAAVEFIKRFGGYARVNIKALEISIGTGDAAKTAIMYGAAVGAVQNLVALLYTCKTLKTGRKTVISVSPDYLSDKIEAKIDIKLTIRIWRLLTSAIFAGVKYLGDDKINEN